MRIARRKFLGRSFVLGTAGIFVPRIVRAQLGDPAFVSSLTKPTATDSACGVLTCENFEDASTGYDNNNANSWTDAGTPNPKYTTDILEGTQSLMVDISSSTKSATLPFTGQSNVWIAFMFKHSGTYTGTAWVFEVQNSSGTLLMGVSVTTGASMRFEWRSGGSAAANSAPRDTLLYVWLNIVKGTGSDATADLYASSTTTKPASTLSKTDGTWTTDAAKFTIGGDNGANSFLIKVDHIRVCTSDPGSTFPS